MQGGGLGYALMRAAQAWRAELADELTEFEVTPPQFFALTALLHRRSRGRAAPTQRELAQRSGMDPNTASQVLRGLERRGLVARTRHPGDSRAIALELTERGLPVATECAARARALNRRF